MPQLQFINCLLRKNNQLSQEQLLLQNSTISSHVKTTTTTHKTKQNKKKKPSEICSCQALIHRHGILERESEKGGRRPLQDLMPTMFWDLYFHFIKWSFIFNSISYLPILGIDKIMGTNCFVGSQKTHLAPVVIFNSDLFWSSECRSGATHTFHIHMQDVGKSTTHLTFTPTRPFKILETFHIIFFPWWRIIS